MTETIDTRGLRCPLPVLKARKRLKSLEDGTELTLIADDPAAIIDVPHFCAEQGHMLESQSQEDGVLTFVIQKGSAG
jgi:tRNA 2-thiouridine synthesizing protein A